MSEDNTNWTNEDDFKPGSMGCHEALHMTAFLESAVNKELLQHPSIANDPAWFHEAHQAVIALARLYQLIAGKHFSS